MRTYAFSAILRMEKPLIVNTDYRAVRGFFRGVYEKEQSGSPAMEIPR